MSSSTTAGIKIPAESDDAPARPAAGASPRDGAIRPSLPEAADRDASLLDESEDESEEDFDLPPQDDYELLVDIINGSDDAYDPAQYASRPNPEQCTVEEARDLRRKLRELGPSRFVAATITAETITAKKLITAFGVRPPEWFEGRPDTGYYQLLGLTIARESTKRRKLAEYNTIEDVVRLLSSRRQIVIITGAGISTNLGVPDFRSTKTGFYAKMKAQGFDNPEDIFDIDTFDETPQVFFQHSSETLPAPGKSTPTHQFIKLLDDRNILLTNYTQNIDNIEGNVGISPSKLIQCHGSWATFTCRSCKFSEPGIKYYDTVKQQQVPYCPACPQALKAQQAMKRKRGTNSKARRSNPWDGDSDEDEGIPRIDIGVMKPDITFFGEKLPDVFFRRFSDFDREKADLVIVIGTSMMVAPVSEIPAALPPEVPCIYISRAPVSHIDFDVTLLGDCDLITAELARRAGWNLKHPMLPSEAKKLEVVPEPDRVATWHVRPEGEKDPAEVAKERGEAEV